MNKRLNQWFVALLAGLWAGAGIWGEPRVGATEVPGSAYIDLNALSDLGYPGAVCYLASAGQLVNYYDSSTGVADILVCSGFCSEYAWTSTGGGNHTLDPHRYIYNWKRKIYGGQSLDLYRLMGLVYHLGYLHGGAGGLSTQASAKEITVFANEEEAIAKLKEVIAAGTPVQVHLDFAYVAAEASVYYPFWQNCDSPSSHFVVIHGYDAGYVYYTDNNPAGSVDVDGDSILDGIGVPLSWQAFLDGWYQGGLINTDKRLQAGPYYMFYLAEPPAPASPLQILRYLYERGVDGPEALRSCAAAITAGADGPSCLAQSMRDRKAELTPRMADFLENAGYETMAAQYDQMASLWAGIRDNPNWAEVPAVLYEMADICQSSWENVATLVNGDPAIFLLSPQNITASLAEDPGIFVWAAPLDFGKKIILELAMKDDFSDKKSLVKLKPKAGQSFVAMNQALWWKALAKDDGNRRLWWRVSSGTEVSESAVFEWEPLVCSLLEPADGYSMGAGESLPVSFSAPSLAKKLQLVFSTTGDFADKKNRLAVKVPAGMTSFSVPEKILAKVKKKDDGDGLVSCRLEDADSKKTTIQPSAAAQITLP